MADLLGVEIARPGTWLLSSGELVVTEAMLTDAADYAARPGSRPAPLRLGHVDARFDGEPSLGWLGNLRVEDDGGPVLKGDITGMPEWLAKAAPMAWPDRSMEGWTDYESDGRTYAMVVDGLALLGVTPPGMSTIRSLRDLPQALGVAASMRMVAALRSLKLSAASAAVAPPAQRGAGMDPAKFREALGLSDSASDEDVRGALVAAGFVAAAAPAPTVPAPQAPEPADDAKVAAKHVAGTVMIDASTWDAAQERIKRLEAADAKRRRDERDQVIAAAVREGKFTPARKEHWARLWDADPEGTREVISSLTRNVMPVEAMGAAYDDDEFDAEFASLFPPAPKGH